MTDRIFITGVVIHARHGVMEHETEVGQRFVIDLELSTDLSESSRTDRLADGGMIALGEKLEVMDQRLHRRIELLARRRRDLAVGGAHRPRGHSRPGLVADAQRLAAADLHRQ